MIGYLIGFFAFLGLLLCLLRTLSRALVRTPVVPTDQASVICNRLTAATVVEISRLCPPTLSLRCAPSCEDGRFFLNFELKNDGDAPCCEDGLRLLLKAELLNRYGDVIESVGLDIAEVLPPHAYIADMISLDREKMLLADRLCVRVLALSDAPAAA